uniref:Uncharacterized protein n=1 Tax=Arundo donax TaxID=35708 RepID=A0A0A9HZY6_ARUDO
MPDLTFCLTYSTMDSSDLFIPVNPLLV